MNTARAPKLRRTSLGNCGTCDHLGQLATGEMQPSEQQETGGMTSTTPTVRPRFARVWRGRTTRDKADAYERYWLENGTTLLQAKGALGVQMLREDRETETEFVTVSYWESIQAMTGGADVDPRRTHHLERDPEFLIELPERVQILRILETRGRCTIDPDAT